MCLRWERVSPDDDSDCSHHDNHPQHEVSQPLHRVLYINVTIINTECTRDGSSLQNNMIWVTVSYTLYAFCRQIFESIAYKNVCDTASLRRQHSTLRLQLPICLPQLNRFTENY